MTTEQSVGDPSGFAVRTPGDLAAWLRENARAYYVQNVMDGEEAGLLTADAKQWADDFVDVLDIMLADAQVR